MVLVAVSAVSYFINPSLRKNGHNCFDTDDQLGPAMSAPYYDGETLDCVGSCVYVNEPPNGSCGDDPTPWECNGEDPGGTESGGDPTTDGTDTGGPDVPPFDSIQQRAP